MSTPLPNGSRSRTERSLGRLPPVLREAMDALLDGRIGETERLCRQHLHKCPTDVTAIRLLADVAIKLGRWSDAENLLVRCLELAPDFHLARYNYAFVLSRQTRYEQALAELDALLQKEDNPSYRTLQAATLVRLAHFDKAIAIYQRLLADAPRQPKVYLSYGHALKTVGRQEDSIAAYRTAIELAPELGEAYWSLANLKTVSLTDAELESIRVALGKKGLQPEDAAQLSFALAKALEDRGQYDQAFTHYAEGNEVRRRQSSYSAAAQHDKIQRTIGSQDAAFFSQRAGSGCDAADPIFIVGLPRAGSTLLEQILASHSRVEGTQELPDIIAMARRLGGKQRPAEDSRYPEVLAELGPVELRELGEEYLRRTRRYRDAAPLFIDKMPNNFEHIGLIHLMLPQAKIIDARRHPLACCLSGFKQYFARGQRFSYSLQDIGHYYRDYVALMDHYDTVLPGRVHRVQYEELVADFEPQVRKLLDYCGLEFESGCLAFHENQRAVRTASSEQVRQPVFTDAVEHWRHFLPHLGPLITALGPELLARYPIKPADSRG
ncbi:sulfotransferase [Haliea sp. E1-2-M8]|uniref:tetratricopeptide repeat-containing sulfotransferase family protein n=1 Tax=Haliea sp. E1-2-M8 TaxID=3064706 RepID=UPI0027250BF6|nr:tetratricopeptide repeat-containing sulfotransferase family protein [Haliea sp. E1-2-M8]MDO8861176.1 sulfotransferase [Haliea sp. E1-2-M8]